MARKVVTLVDAKATTDGNGTVEGYASVFEDGPDSYGDVIAPGAYTATLPAFLKDGFVAWSHDWGMPVATPRAAKEDARGLYLTADFHSDPESQRARTVVTERIDRGLSMGLSIGYEAIQWEMRKVDQAVPTIWGGVTDMVRVLKEVKLYEVSLVTVPAQDSARVMDAKGMKYADQAGRVLADLEAFLVRVGDLAELRAGDGRGLSATKRADLEALGGRLEALVGLQARLSALLTGPAKADDGPALAELIRRAQAAGARARHELSTGVAR